MCRARPGREKYELNLVRSITKTKKCVPTFANKRLAGKRSEMPVKNKGNWPTYIEIVYWFIKRYWRFAWHSRGWVSRRLASRGTSWLLTATSDRDEIKLICVQYEVGLWAWRTNPNKLELEDTKVTFSSTWIISRCRAMLIILINTNARWEKSGERKEIIK